MTMLQGDRRTLWPAPQGVLRPALQPIVSQRQLPMPLFIARPLAPVLLALGHACALAQGAQPPAAAASAAAPYQPFVRLSQGPSGPVRALAYSPDGRMLAMAAGSVVRLWDTQRGLDLGYLAGSNELILSLAFSADGQRVAAGSSDTTLHIWNVESGEELAAAEPEVGFPIATAFSSDGRWLAVSGQRVAVYDDAKGERRHLLNPGTGAVVSALRFSADGERLATRSAAGWRLWKMSDGQPLDDVLRGVPGAELLALSPSLAQALRFDGRQLSVLNTANGQVLASTAAAGVTLAVLGPDGRQVAWVQKDGQAWRWRPEAGAPVRLALDTPVVAPDGEAPHLALGFSPDGQRVAVGSADDAARVWDAQGRQVGKAAARGAKLRSIAVSRDGSAAAIAHLDGTATLLDITTGRLLPLRAKPLPPGAAPAPVGPEQNIRQPGQLIDISPDGRIIASVGQGQLRLFGRGTGTELALLGPAAAKDLRYSRDGRLLFVLEDTRLQVWDPAARSLVQQVLLGKEVENAQEIAFNAAGTQLWLWAVGSKPTAYWFAAWPVSAQGLGAAQRLPVPGLPAKLADDAAHVATVSPDGRLLALGDADDRTTLIDTASARVLHKLEGVPWYTTRQFTADGKALLAYGSGSPDHDILRWDVASGKALPPLVGHQAQVRTVAAAPSGRLLLSSGDDRSLILWQATKGEPLAQLALLTDQGWALVSAQGQYELSSPAAEDAVVLRLGDERANMAPAGTQRQRLKPGLLKQVFNAPP